MTLESEFHAWLRRGLDGSGMTIAALSEKSGVSKATIHRCLREDYEFVPSRGTLLKLETALGSRFRLPSPMDPKEREGSWAKEVADLDFGNDRAFLGSITSTLYQALIASITRQLPDAATPWHSPEITLRQLARLAEAFLLLADAQVADILKVQTWLEQASSDRHFRLEQLPDSELEGFAPVNLGRHLLKPSIQIWASVVETVLAADTAEAGFKAATQMLKSQLHDIAEET